MTYPQQQWQQPAPKPASTRGAKILTFIGVGVVLLGLVALIFSGIVAKSMIPTGVITVDGMPGDRIIADTNVPGELTFEGTAEAKYTLWLVIEEGEEAATSRQDVEVRDPEGNKLHVRTPSITEKSVHSVYEANALGVVTAPKTGTYTVSVTKSALVTQNEQLSVSLTDDYGPVADGIFGAFYKGLGVIGLMILGSTGLFIGGGMALGGGVWWGVAAGNKKKQREMAGYQGQGGQNFPAGQQPPVQPY